MQRSLCVNESGAFDSANVGEGRRLALLLRAKRKDIKKTEPVRCLLGSADGAVEASLAENVIRSGMHPADEFDAFSVLHQEKGMAAEDIAARFGVSVAVVRQRLKLAAVSPALMQLYRDDGLTLEQLMAFTITDDHTRQEEAWNALGWDKSGGAIRRLLTEGQVGASDRRAVFVGGEAYVEAGGVVTRDLFDAEGGGFFADAALLERLVLAKLEREAQAVRAEGWAWVMAAPEFDHGAATGMRRVYPRPAPANPQDEPEIIALQTEYDELAAAADDGEATEEMEARQAEIDARLDELQGQSVFDPDDIAKGGAFVSLGHHGGLRVERGFIRKVDDVAEVASEAGGSSESGKQPGLSDKLVADLTAHRTAGLREALANRPDVALLAVTHALAVETFYRGSRVSCLDIAVRSEPLSRHAPGIDESPLGLACSERQERLATLLPGEADELWEALATFPQAKVFEVLAHCAALTVNAVVLTKAMSSPSLQHAQKLAEAVSLDMSQHWQPTVAGYLGRVSKPLILEAVREGVSPQAADNIAAFKKGVMAEAAEKLLNGKSWLPLALRCAA